jgi:hypothetical protein
MAISVAPLVGGGIAHADTLDATGPGSFCENAPTENPFSDVSAEDPALQEIICQAADEVGISVGFVDGTFRPNASTSRRQMALFMVRLADLMKELEADEGTLNELPEFDGANRFTDSDDEEAEVIEAINRLADAGIVLGTTATTYNPAAEVTRRQMLLFITRLIEFVTGAELDEGDGADFPDQSVETAEVQEATDKLFEAGVVEGRADGTFGYAAPITRRQMTWFNMRTAELHFQLGLIVSPFVVTPPSNQSFNVDQRDLGLVQTNDPTQEGVRAYVFSGLDPAAVGQYEVALFHCGSYGEDFAVKVNGQPFPNNQGQAPSEGTFTFRDQDLNLQADDAGDTMNFEAEILTIGFTVVNTRQASNLTATADGTLTVRVGSPNGDGDCAIPVLWQESGAGNNNELDLVAASRDHWNVPAEPFAVGGPVVFHRGEAPNGYDIAGGDSDVIYHNAAEKFWVSWDEGYVLHYGRPGDQYHYDGAVTGFIPEASFAGLLSPGTWFSGAETTVYSRTGNTTYSIDFDYPGAVPTGVSATEGDFDTPPDGTVDDLRVTWTAPSPIGANVTEYCVEYASAANITAWNALDCTTPVVTLSPGDAPTTLTVLNHGIAQGDYRFRVRVEDTATGDGPGDWSLISPVMTIGTPGTAALITDQRVSSDTVVAGRLDTGDEVRIRFNQPMTTTVTNAVFFRWSDADSVYQVACTDNAACTWHDYTGVTNGELRMVLGTDPTFISGTDNGLDITGDGAEMTLVSAGVRTATNAGVNLTDSPDKLLNIAAALP